MAILWCGGEDIDFQRTVAPSVTTTSGRYNSNNARCALQPPQSSPSISSKLFGPYTSGWLHFSIYRESSTDNQHSGTVGFCDSATGKMVTVTFYGQSGATAIVYVSVFDGSATFTALASESGKSIANANRYIFDVQLTGLDQGASGNIKVYFNGSASPIINYTGNLSQSGTMTSFDSIGLGPHKTYGTNDSSEIILADADTRALSLATLAPAGSDGDTHNWTGAYTDVDETSINDTDVLYTNANDVVNQVNLNDAPSGTFSVLAVKRAVRAVKSSDSTPTSIKLGVHATGGSSDDGASQSLTTAWTTYERLMQVNPITGNAFTTSELNALQAQVKSAA